VASYTKDHLSAFCRGRRHVACPHWYAVSVPGQLLCRCTCHEQCPLATLDVVPTVEWMASCVCPGSERSKADRRRISKVLRIDIPLRREATGARLEADGKGEGFFFGFTSPAATWPRQHLSYEEHLGPDMTLRDTAEWIERLIKGSGYRARRVKSGDKSVAAWAVTLG
jgi:hypothetical protein